MVKGKTAFLFPGQGSQYLGMGKWLYDNVKEAKPYFEDANKILGYSLTDVMFNGPEDQLKQTWITQSALYVSSVAAVEWLKSLSIKPEVVAGHSLGEYSALYAAGVFSFSDGLKLVHARGKAMQASASQNPGTMAAVLGLTGAKVEEICRGSSSDKSLCVPANFNSETQIVISGHVDAVKIACQKATENGALKVVPLTVSGAFHSPLMKSAAVQMSEVLSSASFSNAVVSVITNVDAASTTEAAQFKAKLVQQIDHSVRWHDTNLRLLELGIETAVEVGAGKVLSTLFKKCDRKKNVFNSDDFESIQRSLVCA